MNPARVAQLLPSLDRFAISYVAQTGSTNDDLARRSGTPGVLEVLVTEEQTAGRGRSGRGWVCPPGAGLMFSIRLAVEAIPAARRGWIGAVLGLSILEALDQEPAVTARLKWPNDVLVGGAKSAGILAEMAGDQIVVGAGINVSLVVDELPRPDATSLLLAGALTLDRDVLLARILAAFVGWVDRWRSSGGDVDASGIRPAYREACATLGAQVRVELPGGRSVLGTATDVDEDGSIVVRTADGTARFSAGDVVHLRAQED